MFIEDDEEQKVLPEDAPKAEDAPVATPVLDEISWYTCDLPSNGLLGYAPTIEYRDIMVRDEKLLAGASKKTYFTVLNGIVKSLLKDQTIFEKLTISDRDFLVLYIWANNYTPIRDFDVTCPHCTESSPMSVDLLKLDITTFDPNILVPLPLVLKNGSTVKLNPTNIRDELAANKFCKNNPDVQEDFVKMVLSMDTDKVRGIRDKIQWVEDTLTGNDMAQIRGYHERSAYGINDEVSFECDVCGGTSKHRVPFRVDFLLPNL